MEINLMPPDLMAKKTFRRRLPFLVGAAVGLVFIMLAWWGYLKEMSKRLDEDLKPEVELRIRERERLLSERPRDEGSNIADEQRSVEANRTQSETLQRLLESRGRWMNVVEALQSCLLDGMWLTSVQPVEQGGVLRAIRITGLGFEDKLNRFASPNDEFKRRLDESPQFSEARAETFSFVEGNYARQFTFSIDLVNPIMVD